MGPKQEIESKTGSSSTIRSPGNTQDKQSQHVAEDLAQTHAGSVTTTSVSEP